MLPMKKFYSGLILFILHIYLFGSNVTERMISVEQVQGVNSVEECLPGQKDLIRDGEVRAEALRPYSSNHFVEDGRFGHSAFEEVNGDVIFSLESDPSIFKVWYRKNENQIIVTTKKNIRFSGALFDITGSVVKDQRKRYVEDRLIFQTSDLKKGIYVVTLYGSGGEVLLISKIVVN